MGIKSEKVRQEIKMTEQEKTIVLATTNPGKVKDYQALFANFHLKIKSQADLNLPEIEETGKTFVENAILKARNACALTGLPALGDDGGLVVEALQGAPGLYSARFAGKKASAEENIQKLLTELNKIPNASRAAQLYLIIVYLRHENDPNPIICEGSWELEIMHEPLGTHGFGYLPILYEPKLRCGAAELTVEEKTKINHRGQAFQKLVSALKHEWKLRE